jgi:hypothetical protein
MVDGERLEGLRRDGRMRWHDGAHGWYAQPDDIVHALALDGYEECKREVARRGRDTSGGVWQGLNVRTGSVASAVWARRAPGGEALVFIDIDGRPLTDLRGDER